MTSLADTSTIVSDADMFVDRARSGTLTIPHVQEAIALGVDIDTESSEDGMTALQYVICNRRDYDATPGARIFRDAEQYGEGDAAVDNNDFYEYVEDDDDGLARYLLIHGADPNKVSGPHARAAIHYAALTSADNMLRLVYHGGNVNLQDGDGNAALHLLAHNPSLEQQTFMLKFIAGKTFVDFTTLNNAGRTAVEEAQYMAKLQYASLLQYEKASYDPIHALHVAGEDGVLTKLMVKQAVAAGVRIDRMQRCDTLLSIVVSDWGHGGPKYEAQSDVDSVVVALLQAGAAGDNNACTYPPFVVAASCGYAHALRRMIEYGVDVNVADSRGDTALIALVGAVDHQLECLQELANAPSIDYTYRNSHGLTAEEVAYANGQHELAGAIKAYREQKQRWSRERATWLDATSSAYELAYQNLHDRQVQRARK
jgi:ankyrin repeat protein